jgi:hypothetical protein
LNDWIEVDAIVTALADDVLESFNPDPDYDGIPGKSQALFSKLYLTRIERAGALQNIGEDVEAFLPESERKRRKKNTRNAKWAINVGNQIL